MFGCFHVDLPGVDMWSNFSPDTPGEDLEASNTNRKESAASQTMQLQS